METPPEKIASLITRPEIRESATRVMLGERLSFQEALNLYEQATLPELGMLANLVNSRKNGALVLYNKNIHIEPTNICRYQCLFCSYSKKEQDNESWVLTPEALRERLARYTRQDITEIHMVGGCHPSWKLDKYLELVHITKKMLPQAHLKAFSAVEVCYIAEQTNLSYQEILTTLQSAGVESLPGGGAEIFNPAIRQRICHEKASTENWLAIHQTAHKLGMPTNATMLYGHIESVEHRIEHMDILRDLQDQTQGFMAFIPLKFRNKNNRMSHLREVPFTEDLKTYALSRLYLDNIQHIKAYWPMLGIDNALIALSYGANDLDGTIDDTTKIYSMAGVKEKASLTTHELESLIRQVNKKPSERDSCYRIIQTS